MIFDSSAPLCDGIWYSDLWRIKDSELQRSLCARGVVYATQFCDETGTQWGGDIICRSWTEAEQIAFSRGLEERVTFKISEFNSTMGD